MFVHHNGHERTKETSDLKIVNFKKRIGIDKASNEKVWKQGKGSDSMESVKDGEQGSLKSEIKLEDH